MSLEELVKAKRDEILHVAARHGARNVRIFGSVARGESTPTSDVDLLVDVGPTHSSFFPAGLVLDLEELLGRQVDVLTAAGIHWYIRDRVLEEARPL